MTTSMRRIGAFLIAFLLIGLLGCGPRRPETVPVSGTITLGGGPWPCEAMIFFGGEPAAGLPKRTGSAVVAKDGSFTVSTFAGNKADGLMPGKYQAYVLCDQVVNGKTISHVPMKYQISKTSGFELDVQSGADPIKVLWDVPTR
jgi:hypothetical protein